jgi:glucosyl-3-phosphoglycerate synthase
VMYLDTDTGDFDAAFAVGILGPLLHHPGIALVKGAYRRPFRLGEVVAPDQGGRVTELVARPLLNLFAPELAGFRQPLAGEVAARRELLEALPFPVGYGVETSMMIDAVRLTGIDALAQVDLGTRQNRHQPLRDLSAMAYAVMVAGLARALGPEALERLDPDALVLPGLEGPELRRVPIEERPPLRSLAGRLSPG